MMHFTCKHGKLCRDCDECYDDARADSEILAFGIFSPSVTKCAKHPGSLLTENWDCLLCRYGDGSKRNGNAETSS